MEYKWGVARAERSADVFLGIAEHHRRRVLESLLSSERAVNDIVRHVRLRQPEVSKHLHVLRRVGLVNVRRDGRRRLYRVNGATMKTLHDWVGTFERFWQHQADGIKARAEAAHAAAVAAAK